MDETPEQREERLRRKRKHSKLSEYMKAIGTPLLSKDIDEVQRRLRRMHYAGGMSTCEMARQSGVTRDVIGALILGVRRRYDGQGDPAVALRQMRSSTIRKLMAMEYVPPNTANNRNGARLPAHGKRRRLQALVAAGYTVTFLAAQLGMGEFGNRNLNMFMHGHKGKKFAFASSVFNVAQLYDKLAEASPEDFAEIPRDRIKAARTLAKKHDWAPPGCWDEDTIDDPAAVPEWTGACGTPEGYAIHAREEIPVCPACDAAVRKESPRHSGGQFSPPKFRILIEQRGLTVMKVAELAGATDDSVRRWSAGERRPNPQFLEALASALDCAMADLLDGDGEEVFFDSNFNRGAFIAALEEKKVSKRQLGAEIGVSNMAVYYWCTGKNIPKIPKIAKAAEVLGMDWKEFYR